MNKLSFIVMAGLLLMMGAGASATISTPIQAETFTVSDHPSSMDILSLINMYNENNPNSPIVCSSGFVFPVERNHDSHSSSSSTTSIINQIGNAINDAVAGVDVPATGHNQHQPGHNNNSNHNSQETIDMTKRTSTPLPDSQNTGNNSDDSGQDDNDGRDDSSSDSDSSDSNNDSSGSESEK